MWLCGIGYCALRVGMRTSNSRRCPVPTTVSFSSLRYPVKMSNRSVEISVVRFAVAILTLALTVSPALAEEGGFEPFEFALIGDYPYFPRDYVGIPFLLDDLREDGAISFVLHLGDLHNPRFTACSEPLYRERREWFFGLGVPFILTPGDNDWADCAEDRLGNLETIRSLFFADPTRAEGEDGFSLRSQSEGEEFPEVVENAIWERNGVVFATLHMIAPGMNPLPNETSETRGELIAAAEAWLDEAFRVAHQGQARGVFLATQVNLWPLSGNPEAMDLVHPDLIGVNTVFAEFEERLIRNIREFGGPVILANGDTHYFRVDKPLVDPYREAIQTFTRVEGFGSPHGHWVRVRVVPDRPEVFQFQQELVPENLYTRVSRAERGDDFEEFGLGRRKIILRIFQATPKLLAVVGAFAIVLWTVSGIRRLRN